MTATLPNDVDRLEAHEVPAEYSQKRMRAFVEKTRHAQGAELANAQTVFNLLCEALQVTGPSLKKAGADNPYCFEADVLDGKVLPGELVDGVAHRLADGHRRRGATTPVA